MKTKTELVFKCPFFKIIKEDVELPDGKITPYYIHTANNPFVAIVAIDHNKVLIQQQYRQTLKVWNWEFPMGAMDKKETALDAAKRELLEETGFRADNWAHLGLFYVGPGHTNNLGTVFLAQELTDTKIQKLEESEIIKPEMILISDFEKMIAEGTINDGPTLAAWQIYQQKIVNKVYESYLPKKKK